VGRDVAVVFGVLVGAAITYTEARVTPGVGLGRSVDSGVGAGMSAAMAVRTVDGPTYAGRFSPVRDFVRNCATAKEIADVVETVASPMAQRALPELAYTWASACLPSISLRTSVSRSAAVISSFGGIVGSD